MSRLKWDETGKRKYENGVSHVVLYTKVPWADRNADFGGDLQNLAAGAYSWAGETGEEHPYGIKIYSPLWFGNNTYRVTKLNKINHSEDSVYDATIYRALSVRSFKVKRGTLTITWREPCSNGNAIEFGELIEYTDHVPFETNFKTYVENLSSNIYAVINHQEIHHWIFDSSRRNKVIVEPFNEDDGMTQLGGVYIYPDSSWTQSQLTNNWPTTEGLVEIGFTGDEATCPFYIPVNDPDSNPYVYASPWNGVTNISENPDGAEKNDMWADNMKYSSPRSVENYGITIEAYTYPDAFAMCDGSREPVAGAKIGQQKRNDFCLAYRTEVGTDSVSSPDGEYLLHLVYGLTASPTDRAYETINDSPDAITFSWECDSNPVVCVDEEQGYNFKPVSSVTIDSSRIRNRSMLTAFEDILFGTDAMDPRIPYPLEILELLQGESEEPTEEDGPIDVETNTGDYEHD